MNTQTWRVLMNYLNIYLHVLVNFQRENEELILVINMFRCLSIYKEF